MTRFLVFVLTMHCLSAALPASKCEITGQVIHVSTGAPIPRARIALSDATGPSQVLLETMSDAHGHFRLSGMQPGKYSLKAGRFGFVEYGSSADPSADPIVLTAGQKLENVIIKLSPQAVITGRVFQEDGDPFPGVLLLATRADPGQNAGESIASYAYTNDLGEYRLSGLLAGRYYVRASHRGTRETIYYPRAATLNDAVALEVAAGSVLTGIDVTASAASDAMGRRRSRPPQSGNEPAVAVVQGQVVNAATGAAVPRARVFLDKSADGGERSESSLDVAADASGFFTFKSIQPGSYHLSARRQGFLATEAAAAGNVVVPDGQPPADVTLKLTPAGVIAGKISGEDGDPQGRAIVMAIGENFSRGRQGFTVVRRVYTDDLGQYRLYDLPPGRYYVSVLGSEGFTSSEGAAARDARRTRFVQVSWKSGYPPAYYPSATSLKDATPLMIRPGSTLGGIDLRLSKLTKVRVSGRIVLPADTQLSGAVAVSLIPADLVVAARYSRRSTETKGETKEFELRRVPPGEYILAADWADEDKQYSARRTISIGKSNVAGLVLALQPALQISGQLQMEGGHDFDFSGLHVSLQGTDGEMIAFGGDETVNQDGSFTIENVRPGRYSASISGLSANNYLKAVYYDGKDVTYSGIDLGLGAGTIELVLSPAGGGIEGTVLGSGQGSRAAQATVALVPEAALAEGRELYRTVVAGHGGEFSLHGIAPGRYELIASDDIDSAQELLALDHAGESVTIEENRTEKVQLTRVSAQPY